MRLNSILISVMIATAIGLTTVSNRSSDAIYNREIGIDNKVISSDYTSNNLDTWELITSNVIYDNKKEITLSGW